MKHKWKRFSCLIVAVIFSATSLLPVFAENTGSQYEVVSAQASAVPVTSSQNSTTSSQLATVQNAGLQQVGHNQIDLTTVDGIKRTISDKSMIHQKNFGDLLSGLRYKGNALAEKTEFTGIEYTYSSNVKMLPDDTLAPLKSQNNQTARSVQLDGTAYAPGTVLVDKKSKQAVRVGQTNIQDGTAALEIPSMSEVFDKFNIPEQTVHLKEGNIDSTIVEYHAVPMNNYIKQQMEQKSLKPLLKSKLPVNNYIQLQTQQKSLKPLLKSERPTLSYLASNPEGLSSGTFNQLTSSALEDLQKGDVMLEMDFPTGEFDATTASGKGIKVRLGGNIKIGGVSVIADYSMFDGYKFGLGCAEEINVNMQLMAALDEEVYIPIVGLDIPFGIGGVKAGLFLIAGINGEMKIGIAINQGMGANASVSGGTFFGVPTGLHPNFEAEKYVKFDTEFEGVVSGGVYLAPVIEVRLLGMDVFRTELRLGGIINAQVSGPLLDVSVDAVMMATLTIVGKDLTLLNAHWQLFHISRKYTGTYKLNVDKRCAYEDLITGSVKKGSQNMDDVSNPSDLNALYDPYANKPVKVIVRDKHGNVKNAQYQSVTTKSDGSFQIDYSKNICDMVNGDTVSVAVTEGDKTYESEPLTCTFPFDTVTFNYADYFNDKLDGVVKAVVSKNANGNEYILNYTGNMELYYLQNNQWNKVPGADFQCINGVISKNYDFKPGQSYYVRLVSDEFEVLSNVKCTDIDFLFQIQPTICRDYEWPVSNQLQNQAANSITYARNMHTYIFMYTTIQNLRGTKKPTGDLFLNAQFNRYTYSTQSHIFEKSIIGSSNREYTVPLFPDDTNQMTGKGRGIELYTYRWPNQGTTSLLNPDQLPSAAPTPSTGVQKNVATGLSLNPVTVPGKKVSDGLSSRTDVNLNYGPVLIDQIQETWTVPSFGDNKAYWKKAIQADYLDTGAEPITYYNSFDKMLLFEAVATFTYEWENTQSEALRMNFSGEGIKVHLVGLKEALQEQLENEKNTGIIQNLSQLEKDLQLARDRAVVTHPDDLDSMNSQLKNDLNKKYVEGSIANERLLPSWAVGAVKNMVAAEIMDLGNNKDFYSNRNISRGEFAAFVSRALEFKNSGTAPFRDVSSSYKYQQGIAAAYENGIINGTGNGNFSPDALLTREQAATILYKGLIKAYGADKVNARAVGSKNFSDGTAVSGYAKEAVGKMASAEIINGFSDGTFAPARNLTMAQTAVMLNQIVQVFAMN